MSIQLNEENGRKILLLHANRKLVKADYEHSVSELERLVLQHGKLSVLFDLTGFHDWEAGGLWDEIRFDIRHFADIERIAVVGDKTWHHGMATFFKPFIKATIRYFNYSETTEGAEVAGRSAPAGAAAGSSSAITARTGKATTH